MSAASSDHPVKSSGPRGFKGKRWLLTIFALLVVNALLDKVLSAGTLAAIRETDDAFIAQLGAVEPFHLSQLYYHYVASGELQERNRPTEYANFADEWRENSAPPPTPTAGEFLVRILAGPFAVLFQTWSEGAVAFLTTLFGLILGTFFWWKADANIYAKVFLIPVTGSAVVWVLWAIAAMAGAALHWLVAPAAMLTTIPLSGLLAKTVIDERQHVFVERTVGKLIKGSDETH
ncbi:MAG: hypothetical protein WA405_00155 [Candidatus Acidiferrales bacterium]